MKAHNALSSFHHGGFFTALTKVVALFAVLCVCVNTFTPRLTVETIDTESFREILSQQPNLLYFFSLSSLPLAIMNDIMSDRIPSTQPEKGKKPVPKKQTDRHASSSAEFSLVRADRTETLKADQTLKAGSSSDHGQTFLSGRHPPPQVSMLFIRYLSWQSRLYLFWALMFFFLLPRSSVNEDASMNSMNKRIPAGVLPAGFFICAGNR
jgi:hypothetical protein